MAIINKMALLLAAVILTASCQQASVDTVNSGTVQSSTVYQDYRVEADRTQTRVAATFRVGGSTGTTIELSERGKVLHNGEALTLSAPANLLGTNYRTKGTDYRGDVKGYQPNHEFVFTDGAGGVTYKNSLNLVPLEVAAGKSELVFRKSQPTVIRLSRRVGAGETLSLGLNTSVGDDVPTRDNSVSLTPTRDALVITPQYWQGRLSGGRKASLQIKVSRRQAVTQGATVGGAIQIVYSAAPVTISAGRAGAPANAKADADAAPTGADNTAAANPANTSSGGAGAAEGVDTNPSAAGPAQASSPAPPRRRKVKRRAPGPGK